MHFDVSFLFLRRLYLAAAAQRAVDEIQQGFARRLEAFKRQVVVVCAAWQVEKCPTSGRLHVHCYVKVKEKASCRLLHQAFQGCHLDVCKGTEPACRDYVTKEASRVSDGFFEFGNFSKGQGARNDLQSVRDAFKAGSSIRSIVVNGCSYQALKFAECAAKYLERVRDWRPVVWWFHGSTGSGKSRTAFEMCAVLDPEEKPWVSMEGLKWLQGYDAQKCAIIEDFRKNHCTFVFLLRLFDRNAFAVEFKGGSRQMLARWMFVTSPYDPVSLYGSDLDRIEQLMRRLSCECVPKCGNLTEYVCQDGTKYECHVRQFGNAVQYHSAAAPHFRAGQN